MTGNVTKRGLQQQLCPNAALIVPLTGGTLLVGQHGVTQEHKLYSLCKTRVTALRPWQATAWMVKVGQL